MRHRILALALALISSLFLVPVASAQVTWNSVRLTWIAVGDDSVVGTASSYDIRYSTSPITVANFASATPATGEPVPASPGNRQYYTVTGLVPATTYWFAIKTADEVPNWAGLSNVISQTTPSAPDTIRPAQIANLNVTGVTGNSVALQWTAVGDDSLTGTAAAYDLRYSTSPITSANWATAIQATGEPAPGSPGASQTFTVTGLASQVTYYFAVRASDEAGNPGALSNVPTGTTVDVTPPAAITNLAVGWMWLSGTASGIERPRAARPGAPRSERMRR